MIVLSLLAAVAALGAASGPVEHASADDCAVIAEIGRGALSWGEIQPSYDFFSEWDTPGGGIYVQDCDWAALGLSAPRAGSPASMRAFFITRPVYVGDRAHATFQVTLREPPGPEGRTYAPFISEKHCELIRKRKTWKLVACRQGPIT